MYAKIPVICSNVGGCPEIVKNNKTGLLLTSSNSIEDLVNKLRVQKTRESLIDSAYQFVKKNFNVDSMLDSTIHILTIQ